MKNAFEGLIRRPNSAEDGISKFENISIETSKTEKEREKRWKKTEQRIQERGGNYKSCNICIVGMPKGEERKEQKKKSETMTT